MPRAVRQAYLAPYFDWAHRIAVLRFVQDIPLEPSHPSFALVEETENRLGLLESHPMLICWGLGDFIFDKGFLERWTEFFPRARVHQFREAGHYVLEDAGDRIIPLIRDFLKESG
jgi:haloalkane dehalogenase